MLDSMDQAWAALLQLGCHLGALRQGLPLAVAQAIGHGRRLRLALTGLLILNQPGPKGQRQHRETPLIPLSSNP